MNNDRKAFNFYRSYYDVALLLPEPDQAEFLMAICLAQFTGQIVEPKLPMAKLAFASQLHSINKQLEGFIHGKKTPPRKEPLKGLYKEPLLQEQEQVQVQEKEQVKEKEYINTSITSNNMEIDTYIQDLFDKKVENTERLKKQKINY
jgi:hypothetical protein